MAVLMSLLCGCTGIRSGGGPANFQGRITEIKDTLHLNGVHVFNSEVVIYPTAFLTGNASAKAVFERPVVVLGKSRVFDPKLEMSFSVGCIEELNPVWFGARGYDDKDDTEAFLEVFKLASESLNAIVVRVPSGRYYISEQIRVESNASNKVPIHMIGTGSSPDGLSGSSLIWSGDPGQSMILMRNMSQSTVIGLDFTAKPNHWLLHNIELRPTVNQVHFENCLFSGCAGISSSNINLNEGNNLQVSEVSFENCLFRGLRTHDKLTINAVRGGWANTKDFYFDRCSFGMYQGQAICITTSDVLVVENCTFFENDVDIYCETCKTRAVSNYSEESAAFFEGTASSNLNATTLINNQFTGKPTNGYVLRYGSGTLILLNNNFGAGNYSSDLNRVKWFESEYNIIYSAGNVFKNASPDSQVFFNQSNLPYNRKWIFSLGDLGGTLGSGRIALPDIRRNVDGTRE